MDSVRSHPRCDTQMPSFNFVSTSVIKKLPDEPHSRCQALEVEGSSLPSAEGDDSEEELNPELEEFSNDTEYYLCCMGYIIGHGNMLRFPYVLATNGGAVFFIPYFTMLALVVIPLFALETAWGQIVKTRLQDRFAIVHPGLWGFSLAIVWMNFWTISYYTLPIVWALHFLVSSFIAPLPWRKTEGEESLWNTDYFPDHVLQRSASISEPLELVPELSILLVVTYLLFFIIQRKGLKATSKIVYFTVTAPYLLMFTILLKSVTLEGSEAGLRFLFVPEWSCLLKPRMWREALLQVVYSTGVGFGTHMFYASARKPHLSVLTPSTLLPLQNALTSIIASITLFGFLGHVATVLEVDIKDIIEGGYNLAFIAYPGFLTTLALPNLWALLFFSMVLLLGVDSLFGMQDVVIAFAWHMLAKTKLSMSNEMFVLCEMATLAVIGLIFTTTNGWWWFEVFQSYAAGNSLLFIIVGESLILGYYFGVDRIESVLREKTRERFPLAMKIVLQYFSIPLMTLVLIYSLKQEFKESTAEVSWQRQWIGRAIMTGPLLLTIMGFLIPRKAPRFEALVLAQRSRK